MSDSDKVQPADVEGRKPTPEERAELIRAVAASRKAARLLVLQGEREAREAYEGGGNGHVYGGFVVHPDKRGAGRRR